MKKMLKLTALLLMLVLTLGMACGCSSGDEEEEVVIAELTIGLPYDESDPEWATIEKMMKNVNEYGIDEGFLEFQQAEVTFVKVPKVGTEAYADFLKDVSSGKVHMFLAPSSKDLETLIEDGKIATTNAIVKQDSRFEEGMIPSYKCLNLEIDRRAGSSIPYMGTYQGLFLNTDLFERAGVEIPTNWSSFMSAVKGLQAKGITPFAAGFADGGSYWIDEMILAEGGSAEHTTPPSKGVIDSWTRAINRIKNFYDSGWFTSSALTDTHATAVSKFLNKDAAMILCSSTDLCAAFDTGTIKYISFPSTDTGKKEEGVIIAQSVYNFYINAKALKKAVGDVDTMANKFYAFINDYMAYSDYYPTFALPGAFPFNTAAADAYEMDSYYANTYEVISGAKVADMPMSQYIITFDNMESGLINVLNGQTTVDEYLKSVSDAEIKAQAEKRAAELEEK